LTREEILLLSSAIFNQKNGLTHFSLFYEESDETGKQLSHVIELAAVRHMEADDTYYDIRDLEIRGFKTLRLLKEPGPFTRLAYKIKWWREDRKRLKGVK